MKRNILRLGLLICFNALFLNLQGQNVEIAGSMYIGDFAPEGPNPGLKVKMVADKSGILVDNRNRGADIWIPYIDGSVVLTGDATDGRAGDIILRKFESNTYKTLVTLDGPTKSVFIDALRPDLFSLFFNPLRDLYINEYGEWKTLDSSHVISFAPSAFRYPQAHTPAQGAYKLTNTYVAIEYNNHTGKLYAQVILPNRAKVSGMFMYAYDSYNAGDIICTLFRRPNFSGNPVAMAITTTSNTPGDTQEVDYSIMESNIDNLNYHYYIELSPTTTWSDGASGLELGLYSVQINYYFEE